MIQLTPQMRMLVAVEPADFRKGIDGLARLCQEVLEEDPFRGWVFVFRNRKATAVKVLVYDGQGFWLCHKRLSSRRFLRRIEFGPCFTDLRELVGYRFIAQLGWQIRLRVGFMLLATHAYQQPDPTFFPMLALACGTTARRDDATIQKLVATTVTHRASVPSDLLTISYPKPPCPI